MPAGRVATLSMIEPNIGQIPFSFNVVVSVSILVLIAHPHSKNINHTLQSYQNTKFYFPVVLSSVQLNLGCSARSWFIFGFHFTPRSNNTALITWYTNRHDRRTGGQKRWNTRAWIVISYWPDQRSASRERGERPGSKRWLDGTKKLLHLP